jgi:hypothetical protein
MTKPRNETPEQREKRLAYHRAYSRSALGRASDKRRYTPERKRKITANKHLRMHGITRSEVDTLAQRQDHKCGICSKPFTDFERGGHLDHCHLSGLVRGLLCPRCNTAEGSIANTGLTPELFVKRLLAYLANPPSQGDLW